MGVLCIGVVRRASAGLEAGGRRDEMGVWGLSRGLARLSQTTLTCMKKLFLSEGRRDPPRWLGDCAVSRRTK